MHWDRVRVRFLVYAVKFLLQHGFRHDAPEPPHHLLEDCQLSAGQPDGCPGDCELPSDSVEPDIAGFELYSQHTTGAAQQGVDPGDQLAHREGFGQVIVSPALRPATLSSTASRAVRIRIGSAFPIRRAAARTASPSPSGKPRSRTAAS